MKFLKRLFNSNTKLVSQWFIFGPILALIMLAFFYGENNIETQEESKELMVTFEDSLSYTIGVNVGNNLPKIGINQQLFIEGITDYWNNKNPRINAPSRQEILRTFNIQNSTIERDQMKAMTEKAKQLSRDNKIKGQEFLDKNKLREGVRVFNRSQIQYKVIKQGNGEIPEFNDSVIVHYNGYLIDGYKFDSSYDRGQPATFALNSVIVGWQQILQKMPVGSKWEVFIPENLAYGVGGVASDPKKGEYVIPPSSTLIFEIELIEIVR